MFSITNFYVKHNDAIMRTRGVYSTKAYTINNLRTLNRLSVKISKLLLQNNLPMEKMSGVFISRTRLPYKGSVLDPIHKYTTKFTIYIYRFFYLMPKLLNYPE